MCAAVRVAIEEGAHLFATALGVGLALTALPGLRIDGFAFVAGEIRGNLVGGFPCGKSANSGFAMRP
jgi:hypothetical protein